MKRPQLVAVLLALAVSALALLPSSPAISQGQPQAVTAQTPQTRDAGALITMTTLVASTVVSSDQSGYNASRVSCILTHASKVGTPASVFKIQGKDVASGLYYDMITSASLTNTATANPIYVGAGLTAAANSVAGLPVPRFWRVSLTVTGTTSVTGTIGCSVQ